MTHIRKHERPTTTAAGGGLLLLLLSAATDVVRATEVYAPDCHATPDGYSSRVGTGCTQYVYCQGGVVTSTYNCPVGMIYNGKVCDWAVYVECAPNIPMLVDDERFFLPETTTLTPEISTATTTAPDSSFGAGFLCGNSLTELETTCGILGGAASRRLGNAGLGARSVVGGGYTPSQITSWPGGIGSRGSGRLASDLRRSMTLITALLSLTYGKGEMGPSRPIDETANGSPSRSPPGSKTK